MKKTLQIFAILLFTANISSGQQATYFGKLLRETIERPENANKPLDIILYFKTQPDIATLEAKMNQESISVLERPRLVIRLLMQTANQTQKGALNQLAALKKQLPEQLLAYKPYWIVNVIKVKATKTIIDQLAQRTDLEFIDMDPDQFAQLDAFEAKGDLSPEAVNGAEPGLRTIKANELWAMGYTGRGRLVYSVDTGVDPTHPALSNKFRGLNFPVAECWRSTISNVPADCDQHGTHTTGTMVGLDPLTKDTIGVAPQASWIAADALCSGSVALTDALQWALNPDGDTSTTNDVPDVINNSWNTGTGTVSECNGQYRVILDALEAAGIAPVFSAGNTGPNVSTITSPKNINSSLVNVFCVANLTANLGANSSSSRGPSICGGTGSLLIKPEVSAPGTNIRSSVPGGQYALFTGTSMATPHVAGAIALLKEAFPLATGTQVKLALYRSATDLGTSGEDNTFGMGLINLKAAYDSLALLFTPTPPLATKWDIAVESIITPSNLSFTCNNTVSPKISIVNNGDSTIQNAIVSFGFGSNRQIYNYNGNLAKGKSDTIQLPSFNLTGLTGYLRLQIDLKLDTSKTELDTFNNKRSLIFGYLTDTATLPYKQGFETQLISNTDWAVKNPDNNKTWEIKNTGGNTGSTRSAYLNCFNYADSTQLDYLISPTINAPSGNGKFRLTFKVAYRPYSPNYREVLAVKYTTDCGQTFSAPIWWKTGSTLGTAAQTTNEFTPTNASQWRTEVLNLDTLKQLGSFKLAFELKNGYGNNVYLDDINIEIDTTKPDAKIGMAVTNNCLPLGITLFDSTLFADSTYWVLPSGSTQTASQLNLTFTTPGSFKYTLIGINAFGNDTANITLNVDPDPIADFSTNDTLLTISNNQNVARFQNNTLHANQYRWSFGDGTTSPILAPQKTYFVVGKYDIELIAINEFGCRDTLRKQQYINVLQDPQSTSIMQWGSINIYPNPAKEEALINLQLAKREEVTLLLKDVTGKLISSKYLGSVQNGSFKLPVEYLATGLYFVEITTQSGQATLKLQKQ